MPRFSSLLLLFAAVASTGCATSRSAVSLAPPCCGAGGIVFVADGAGNTAGLTEALHEVVVAQQAPLCVEMVDWSYGPYRFLSDQLDYEHAREAGCRLAARITAYRQTWPDSKIYLVAHSAGSAVVLSAAESLLPDSVERIVLLAPAVSSDYDLRPALRSTHQGIDVFCSERDWAILGLGVGVVGTTDRRWAPAAGRVGFRRTPVTPEDVSLYSKLHEHPWHPCVEWTGNRGGHFDTYLRPRYLTAYILPLLLREAPRAPVAGPAYNCR